MKKPNDKLVSHKKFADTVVDENGNLHAIPFPEADEDPEEENDLEEEEDLDDFPDTEKTQKVKHRKFAGTIEGDDGRLYAVEEEIGDPAI